MGIRDVAVLAEVVVDAVRLGLEPSDCTALERYESWRHLDNLTFIAVTSGLNKLFSNDHLPLRLVRGIGLSTIDKISPLKRVFMRHAMGVVGEYQNWCVVSLFKIEM